MEVRPLTYAAALYVANRMRPADYEEIVATKGHQLLPERLAMDLHSWPGIGYVLEHEGIPVVVIGAVQCHAGLWSIYMFATDRISEVGLPLTRWVKKDLLPEIFAAGAHRIECNSIESHTAAHAWMEVCGAKNEGAMPKFGIGQETFYRFAVLKDA